MLLSPMLQVYDEPNHSKIFTLNVIVFSSGESTYNLTDAQVLRVKLLKLAESIDSLRWVTVHIECNAFTKKNVICKCDSILTAQ